VIGRHSEATRAKIREALMPYARAKQATRVQQDAAVAALFAPILRRLIGGL
jgi:hypothetical protein